MCVSPHQIKSLGLWESSGEQSLHSTQYISHNITGSALNFNSADCKFQLLLSQMHNCANISIPRRWLHLYLNPAFKYVMLCSSLQSLTMTTKSCWRLTGNKLLENPHDLLCSFICIMLPVTFTCATFYKQQMFSGCTGGAFYLPRSWYRGDLDGIPPRYYKTQTVLSDYAHCKPWMVPVSSTDSLTLLFMKTLPGIAMEICKEGGIWK